MRKAILLLIVLLLTPLKVNAEEMHKCTLTSYLPTGNDTCLCEKPRKGILAARKEWLYKTAAVYVREDDDSLGEFIGYYEVLDSGEGYRGAIRKGYVVDAYCEKEEDLIPTTKVYVFLFDAEG